MAGWARTAAVAVGAGAAGAAVGPAVGPALWAGGRAAAGVLAGPAPPAGGPPGGGTSVEALLAQVLAQQRGPGSNPPPGASSGLAGARMAAAIAALAGTVCLAASWSPGDLWFVSRGVFRRGLQGLDSRVGAAAEGLERAWRALQEQSGQLGDVVARQEEGLEEQSQMARRLEVVGEGVERLGGDVRALHAKVDSGNRGLRLLCQALFHGALPSPAELDQLSRDLGLPPFRSGTELAGPRPDGLKAVPTLARSSAASIFTLRMNPANLWTRAQTEEDA